MDFKVCAECEISKPLSDFTFRPEVGYYRRCCKICKRTDKKVDRSYKDKNKKCTSCGILKPVELFSKRKDRGGSPVSNCAACESARGSDYYKSNTHQCKNRNKQFFAKNSSYRATYYKNNKEKLLAKSKRWVKNNKDKVNFYQKNKYKTDLNYNLSKKLRVRFYKAIIRNSKKSSVLDLLGCSLDDFKLHLERQFSGDMNWSEFKKGAIHIDHIKPLSRFDLTKIENQLKAWNYTNMQPLWAKDNFIKSDIYDGD